MAQKNKVKELVGRGLNSYHTKALQQMDRIEKKNKEQNHKISILSNELDNDYLTKTEEGSVVSLEHSKEGMVYLDELQGNTLVNYCTDGSKEMTLNGDIDAEGTFITTTEGVDNGKVDVYCEGNTLVNVLTNMNTRYGLNYSNGIYTDTTLHNGFTTNGLLKNNTTYTIIIEFLEMPSDVTEYVLFGTNEFGETKAISAPKTNTKYVISATSRSTDDISLLYFSRRQPTVSGDIKFKAIMLEGDWTNREIPPYFEGMKSVGQDDENGHKIEILSTTNNLLDLSLIDGLVEEGGKIVAKRTVNGSNSSLKLKPNTRYKVTMEKYDSNSAWIGFGYTINGTYTFIGNTNNQNNRVVEFTTPNEKDIIFYAGANGANDIGHYLRLIKLEYANSSSNSSIAKHNKKEISLNEPLRGLSDNIKDRFVKIGGKWFIERNFHQMILDGSERWEIANGGETDDIQTYRFLPVLKSKDSYCIISDKFINRLGFKTNEEGIYGHTNGMIYLSINKSKANDANTLVQWLSENNIHVVYQMQTPIYEPLEIEPTLNTYNEVTYLSNDSIIPCNMHIKNTVYNAIIKPSTLYTVAVDTNKSGTVGINLGGAEVTTTNNVVKITTPATLADDSLRIYGKGIKASGVRLLEGDKTNWIPSFFEGMKSSFEDKVQEDGSYKMEILSVNEHNLLDISSPVQGGWSNGVLNTQILPGDYTFNHFIEIIPNVKYFMDTKNHDTNSWHGFYFFDKNKTQIGTKHFNVHHKSYTFIPPSNANYMVFWCEKAVINYKPILTVYRKQTNYILHKEPLYNKIQFSSIEPLRGVGNYKDKFIFKDNKLMIERNCRQVNMSELNFAGDTSNTMQCLLIHKSKPMAISNIFNNSKNYSSTTKGQMFVQERGNELTYLWIPTDSMSREEFTRFLNEKNATIVYVMSEPTYEEVPFELQKIILEGYENGTLFFDTNIPPTSTITYAGETPIVKATKLNKTEVLNNTNDINDNIIPYLMDMDYRVVCLQLATEEIKGGVSMARLFGGAYEMLKRDILSKRLSRQEYGYRLADYFNAGKLTEEQVRELEELR